MAYFSSNPFPRHRRRFTQTRLISDRISRAISQDLRLLHRSHSSFYILGTTKNVYTVTLSTSPSCNCPDPTTPCKHILFVFIRVLDVSLDDHCLYHYEGSIHPYHLQHLLDLPTSPDALADAALCQRFHHLFFTQRQERLFVEVEEDDDVDASSCPICLEEMKMENKVVACGTCRNQIHEQCFDKWKGSKVNSVPSCVICRAPWYDQHRYLNLSAYATQQDDQN